MNEEKIEEPKMTKIVKPKIKKVVILDTIEKPVKEKPLRTPEKIQADKERMAKVRSMKKQKPKA